MDIIMDTETDIIFFVTVRTETNRNSKHFVSALSFLRNEKNSVCFGVSEPFRNEPKQKTGVSKQTDT
jgi:hypothetical protein